MKRIKSKHALLAVGIVLVVLGHLGHSTALREVVFWLGVVVSLAALGLEVRDEQLRAFQ